MTRKQKIVFDSMPGPKAKRCSIAQVTMICIRMGMMESDIWPTLKWLVDERYVEMDQDPNDVSRYRYRQAEAVAA